MKLKPNQVKKYCKRSPIGSMQMIQGKTRGPKRSTKTQRSGSKRTEQMAGTMGSLWCSPRPVVEDAPSCYLGRMAMRPLCSQVVSLSFAAVRFPAQFSGLCYDLSLKRRMHLA